MTAADVLSGQRRWSVEQAKAEDFLASLPPKSISMILGSPPYEDARVYYENGEDLGIARKTEAWVAWMVEMTKTALRATNGLVAWVVEGRTEDFSYSASPLLLMADLKRAGITLRKPPLYVRDGIPGSGGPDWLKNKYEFIVCATNGGKLPWSNNVAMGHPPKWAPGGEMSHRLSDGQRRNQWGGTEKSGGHNGKVGKTSFVRPSHRVVSKRMYARNPNGERDKDETYHPPDMANPGNLIDCGPAGGGNIGDKLSSENEAPYPEYLCEFLIRSFCPEDGIVCDCFSGSGTTGKVALKWGRRFVGSDLRQSQVDLSRRRIEAGKGMFDDFATTDGILISADHEKTG